MMYALKATLNYFGYEYPNEMPLLYMQNIVSGL